jgi:hypothetical protein
MVLYRMREDEGGVETVPNGTVIRGREEGERESAPRLECFGRLPPSARRAF